MEFVGVSQVISMQYTFQLTHTIDSKGFRAMYCVKLYRTCKGEDSPILIVPKLFQGIF